MTDYRSLYDKDFIGAWDLQEGDLTVTITKVIGGNLTGVGGRKSKKPVVYMSHTDKGFACNVTNGRTIATMYGVHVEKWAGKKITLYKSTTRNPDGTGDVECIRVRPTVRAEDHGASGGNASPAGPDTGASSRQDAAAGGPAPDKEAQALLITAREWADCGTAKYSAWFEKLTAAQQKVIGRKRHDEFWEIAQKVGT